MFYPFVVFFLVLPIIEIWALIKLGNYFGFFGTLIIIIGTAIIGIFIAKQQGLGIIFSLQSKLAQGKQAVPEIVEGLALLIGALFFITSILLAILSGSNYKPSISQEIKTDKINKNNDPKVPTDN